jgi:hypothetical protein
LAVGATRISEFGTQQAVDETSPATARTVASIEAELPS